MSTALRQKHISLPITDLFMSIFGPVLTAGLVLVVAVVLNIL